MAFNWDESTPLGPRPVWRRPTLLGWLAIAAIGIAFGLSGAALDLLCVRFGR